MSKFIDLTGKIFGDLTVLSMASERGKSGEIQWVCKCLCGNSRTACGSILRRGICTQCKSCSEKRDVEDLTGRIFGELTVVSMADERYGKLNEIQWDCKCSCGASPCVTGHYLRQTKHASCQICSKYVVGTSIVDLTGRTFGKLSVISISDKRAKGGQIQWDCTCSCGGMYTALGASLKSSKCVSCGCMRGGHSNKDRKHTLLTNAYGAVKTRHCNKGFLIRDLISFGLFKNISSMPCMYCGSAPGRVIYERLNNKRKRRSDTVIHISGIDRVDSAKGYVEGNVVPCCSICNYMKGAMEQKPHAAYLKQLTIHHITALSEDKCDKLIKQVVADRLSIPLNKGIK